MDASALDVIVLNWRTPDMSADCARLAREGLPGAAIYIVDNGSGDDSPDRIKKAAPWATLVANRENLGFGGGFNSGIQAGRRPFVLTLNSDARPMGPAYQLLFEHCASDEKLGAVTPQIVSRDGNRWPQMPREPAAWRLVVGCLPLGWRFVVPKLYHPELGPPEVIDWMPSMCATVFRRKALENIGGFDAGYFFGWEEWDLTRRLRDQGWRMAIHRNAQIIHEGRGSTPEHMDGWRAKVARQGTVYHLGKYYGRRWRTAGRLASGIADLYTGLRTRTAGTER